MREQIEGQRKVKVFEENTDEWKQQTNTASLILHHQSHTADDNMEETITDAQLPLTANPLPPGGSKPRDGQKGKEGVKCHTACARGTRLVRRPAEGPLKLKHLNVTLTGGKVKMVGHYKRK